jgi:hypothetical protein
MRALCGFILLISIVLVTERAAFAVYPGESTLERIEESMFDGFRDPVPADWKHPKAPEYIVSVGRVSPRNALISQAWSSKCWPAAGKSICGVADREHHLIAFTHYGCCESNAVMVYSNPRALGLPERDLSSLHTANGIRIGSTALQVTSAVGAPTITRDRNTGRFEYGYFRPTAQAGTTICGQWTTFVFDRRGHVIGISDTSGC